MVQAIGVIGGLLIGCALALAIADRRGRGAALVLLVIDAAVSVLAVIVTHQLRMVEDIDRITALSGQRNVLEAIAAGTLAGVFWLYRRQVMSTELPRAVSRTRG